jgi:adenine-specific DNA methylase
LGFLFPELLGSPLTPKRRQAIMASEKKDETERSRYLGLMQQAFERLKSPGKDREFSIVFANADPEAWSALIEGLINAGIVPVASWPIDTEMQSGMAKAGQARLKTSVWMACKPRLEAAPDAFLGDVMADMRPVVRERLLYFWSKGIRGSDFFISAIGPALSVFGRHPKVLKPDGSSVTVRGFLDLVRREATDVALEQVLSGADLGTIDPLTRQYVTWVWSYARAPLDAGEVIALCLATGSSYDDLVRPHSIAVATRDKSKKMVRLRTIKERAAEDEDLGQETGVRVGPLIDQMQFAASLWDRNATTDLATFRGSVGETRWGVLRTLGQAVAASLPEGDEDRRLILGLLGSNVMGIAAPKTNGRSIREKAAPYRERLPGM